MLRIATSQFPVSNDIKCNYDHIKNHILSAHEAGVEVIHFPETSLPGFKNIVGDKATSLTWASVNSYTDKICQLARQYSIWVILGSIRKSNTELPFNSTLVISKSGEIVGHYDKQSLYKSEKDYYSKGTSPFTVQIKSYKCGFLICYDNVFPQLYQPYREMGVTLLFHSFYNAGNQSETSIRKLMEANLIVRSADNQLWISASNSSSSYCPLPASIVRPDGSSNVAERHKDTYIVEDFPVAELGWTYNNSEL